VINLEKAKDFDEIRSLGDSCLEIRMIFRNVINKLNTALFVK